MNLGTLLPRHARHRPDHVAVVFDEHRFTYRQFNLRVNRMANALLGEGIGKGDAVATVLPNGLELLTLYWAAAKTGAVVVPMSPLLHGKAMAKLLTDAGVRMVITKAALADTLETARTQLPIPAGRWIAIDGPPAGYRAFADLVAGASEAEPPEAGLGDADPYNIIYSSGTTGDPKGIVHTHYVRAMYATLFANAWRMTPESVVLHTGAIIFNGAFLTLMPSFYLGGTYILHKQFEIEAMIAAVARERVTHAMMVPAQIIALLGSPNATLENLRSLEMVLSLGAPLHLEHKQRLEALLPGRFHELYGLTEGLITILDKTDFPRKPGSVGVPPPFSEIRVVAENGHDCPPGEVGEIIGRSPILMPGYHNRPDLTAQAVKNGWLHSGDLGYLDEDGFLFLVDRKKDMIISGGVNVYPRDIEEIVVHHPAVAEVAVFGVEDAKWGETPIAAVTLKQPGAVDAETLKAWINANVGAKFQKVSAVLIKTEFPRSAAGKTLKRVMREDWEKGKRD